MYNKIAPSVSITIMIGYLSSVATFNMLSYILPLEAIARTTAQRNDDDNGMLTYENTTYGMRMQYSSDWHKYENVSIGSDNNSTLVDVVKFNPPSKNVSDTLSESLDINVDNISDIKPITLAQYANDTINDLAQDFKIVVFDTNATLADNPAYKFVYTGVEEGVNLQAMLILTIKGDKAYIISYIAEPTKFYQYLPILKRIDLE